MLSTVLVKSNAQWVHQQSTAGGKENVLSQKPT